MYIWLLIFFGLVGAALGIYQLIEKAKIQKQAHQQAKSKADDVHQAFLRIPNFNATQIWIGTDLNRSVAVDESRRIICFLNSFGSPFQHRLYPIRDILDASVVEDGAVITQTKASRSSQIGRALVGGVLLGGVGAVIGGLSAKTVSTSEHLANSIEVVIRVNDTQNPVWSIPFLSVQQPRTSPSYLAGKQGSTSWHALIDVLIAQEDGRAPYSQQVTPLMEAQGSDQYFVLINGEQRGPISRVEFEDLRRLPQPTNALYWTDGMSEWEPLHGSAV